MAGRAYQRLTIEEFGKHLLDSGDLDPIYLGLNRMKMDSAQQRRWLLSYWCYYDAGIASFLSERTDKFWDLFLVAARNHITTPAPIGNEGKVNGGWPRGKERRHFRGMQAVKAAEELAAKFPQPEQAVLSLLSKENQILANYRGATAPEHFKVISQRVQSWRGFGDWISFKVGDMLDRCGIVPVLFSFDDAMYKDPTQAALMQWKVWHGAPQMSTIDDEPAAVREVVNRLIDHFSDRLAPPRNDRPIGYQEVETILCKWKSHVRGHYPLYNDIDEIGHGVAPWAEHSETARQFLGCMPSR